MPHSRKPRSAPSWKRDCATSWRNGAGIRGVCAALSDIPGQRGQTGDPGRFLGADPGLDLRKPRSVNAVDTNLLVYAHREECQWHPQARDCLARLAASSAPWAIPWPCVHEFLAIATHPRIYDPPTPTAIALDQVSGLAGDPESRAAGRVARVLGKIPSFDRDRANHGAHGTRRARGGSLLPPRRRDPLDGRPRLQPFSRTPGAQPVAGPAA